MISHEKSQVLEANAWNVSVLSLVKVRRFQKVRGRH